MKMEGAMTVSAILSTRVAQLNNTGKATALALTPADKQLSQREKQTFKAIFPECTRCGVVRMQCEFRMGTER
jgi:hypothetical protein